jgi:hypothetical protein
MLIMLSSCAFVSEKMVISSENAKSDARLIGVWSTTEPNGKPPIRIEQAKGNALVIHFPDDRNPERLIPIKAFAEKIGNSDYLNLAMEEKDGSIYQILLKYDFEDNKINLYLFDPDILSAKNLVTKDSKGEERIHRSNIEKFRTFLRSTEASKSFELMGSFVRTESP